MGQHPAIRRVARPCSPAGALAALCMGRLTCTRRTSCFATSFWPSNVLGVETLPSTLDPRRAHRNASGKNLAPSSPCAANVGKGRLPFVFRPFLSTSAHEHFSKGTPPAPPQPQNAHHIYNWFRDEESNHVSSARANVCSNLSSIWNPNNLVSRLRPVIRLLQATFLVRRGGQRPGRLGP